MGVVGPLGPVVIDDGTDDSDQHRSLRLLIAPSRLVRQGLSYLPRGQSLSEDVWRVRHRTLSYLLWGHVVAIFCFALIRAYSVPDALMYASIVGAFAVLGRTDPRRRKFVSAMNALGLVTSSAVLVQLSGGLIEMHFHFFVMVGILTLYQDWVPFLLAIGFVVLHHAVLGTLDPSAVYNHPEAVAHPFEWALIHGAFVLAASVASIVAWRLNEEQAFRDALTRLPNRALFLDRVGHALARADRRPGVLAALFVDLDGFKDVNDSLGHAAGDQLLCSVAERLRGCVRAADTVARLGGDEFAILLEDLRGRQYAARVAQRILDALSVPFNVAGRETSVGASIGIALNVPADTVDTLLRNADVAMYTVKDSGRARYEFYVSAMLTSVLGRVDLEHEIRGALEAGQLVVHYQPMIELSTGGIRGLEALVRWQHPTRGLLHPADFIKVAEETGAIVPIGRWVLETACAQVSEWNTNRPDPLRVSVNLSPLQVLHPDIVDDVSRALTRSGLDSSFLMLELTEELLVKDTEMAARRLRQLKALGVWLAIDDFGTGYSSLNYLHRLPFDVLKIDKAFVEGIALGASESALAVAIVNLAKTLGMQAVAEGVERADQADVLRKLGCPFAQGYLFAKAVPAEEMQRLLAPGPSLAPFVR
jgi:diguanylate cyclase (GGDEF)-like protein